MLTASTLILTAILGGAMAAPGNGSCGNGIVEAGEACDDGNTASFDACPSDCVIHDCKDPKGELVTMIKIGGNATAASGDLSALTLFIDYPDGKVQLPGKGPQADQGRFEAENGSAQITVNDLEYGARILMVDPFAKLGATPLKMRYDVCDGAKASATDFQCRVEFAADTKATVLDGVSCSVDFP